MNFKYSMKKIAVLSLSAVLLSTSLTGCGRNTKIVVTTGLSGNQLFKIGSSTCTTPEIMVYLTTFFNEYVETYGQEMWHYDFGGVSLEEHVKDVVLSKMTQIKIMNLMAAERNITLNDKEKSQVSAAAEAYFTLVSEQLKEKEKLTVDIVKKVYEEYALANKVYTTITEAADMEISDDEARAVTAQVIYLKNWKMKNAEKTALTDAETLKTANTAKEVLRKAKDGEDFSLLAAQYGDDKQITKSFARGSVEDKFEELLFSMDEGDISGVIELNDGYYIVKCISTMDYEATQKNKLVLAKQRKQEAFSKAYNEIASNTHSQFRDRQWDSISLDEEIHSTEANFFEIYDEYFK